MKKILCLFILLLSASSYAADAGVDVATGSLLQVIVSLVVVLGVIIAISIGFKKFGINRIQSHLPIKVIGAISIGNHQRLMIIEAGDEWLVLGITPQQISTLTSLPRQQATNANKGESNSNQAQFSAWMQRTIEKYNVKNP